MKRCAIKRPLSAGCLHKMGDEFKKIDIAEKSSPKINKIKEINIKFNRKKLNIPHAQLNNAEEISSYVPKPFWLKDYSKTQRIQILPSNMEYNVPSYIRNDLNKQAAKKKDEIIFEEGTNIKAEIYSLEKRINKKFNKLDNKLDEKFDEMYNVMVSGFDWIIAYLNSSKPPRNISFSRLEEIKIENNNFKIRANSEKDQDDKKISDSGNELSGDVSYNSNEKVEDKKKRDSCNEPSGNVSSNSNSNEQVEQSNPIHESYKIYKKDN